MRLLSITEARRLLLAGQGLSSTWKDLYSLIYQLGFVQVDSINVIERAHHLTLWSRMPGYQRTDLDALLAQRRLFEHWTHDASLIPTAFYPYWHYRFERYKARVAVHRWWRERLGDNADVVAGAVLERIRVEGPLRSRDFEGAAEPGGWWGWKEPKAALEYLWRTGQLAVSSRENFQKVYDLASRVLPALEVPTSEEFVDWACRSALERLGVGTPAEIAGYWNVLDLPEARTWCAREAVPAAVDGKRGFFVLPGVEVPDAVPAGLRILSPFDPILRDRKRALRLFGFDYRFEAFVPAPQRIYGYYVLPVLEGEALVARLDAKVFRSESRLAVQGLWWEPSVRPGKQRLARLTRAVEGLASFVGATTISGL